jgi:replicative DNA helicase
MMLSNTLKEIAATYNVFIQSATQLNDKWEQSIVRNQNHIRGSKAISDKADVGMVSVKLSEVPDEFQIVQDIAKAAGVPMPNVVTDIYKNRRGEYAGVKLFRYFDYGTCRSEDIMLTTLSHQILKDYDKIAYATKLVDLLDLATGGEA